MEMSLPAVLNNQTGKRETKDRRNMGKGAVVGDFIELQFLRKGGVGAEVREEFVVIDTEEVLGWQGVGLAEFLAEHGAEGTSADVPEGGDADAGGIDLAGGAHG